MMPVWIENENRTKLEINETIDEEIGEKQGDFNQLNQLKTELDHNLTEQIRDMLFDGVDERDMEIFNDTSLSSQTIDDDGNVIISSETDDQTLTEMVETTTIGSVQTVTDVNEKVFKLF
ncbi:MAG: hypothetical protein QRY16_19890 [Enterobacterales bacterium endosymbiont of Blomia tropicalis]|uniref:hypothetical protein n=1 Tax=Mixta mediterraneensis TaxID=2758443 RepID=UPI0025A782A6|nr:hypothetical protein [Mixta mediterraneensis]MDL4915944.1 hypothetical protein [Mixta mediterraneensis]